MIDKVSLSPLQMVKAAQPSAMSASDVAHQFSQYLTGAISDLNAQQAAVDKLNTQFIKGEISDVHQVMIASEKASLGLELTVQVRNKVIEAYQEIMRMQV
ncbi:flagellar hook-basal body complex protein FliE [Paenibacillus puerhi]|uniref:flagellar hook-basal body complex protein FliE n=1 Tax=Paenibacillus puerhi TaxID=2692622 RepID=UPI001359762F|nr:flagellar hook-basal body complex protein FliE [Paenibacillus puerhi]